MTKRTKEEEATINEIVKAVTSYTKHGSSHWDRIESYAHDVYARTRGHTDDYNMYQELKQGSQDLIRASEKLKETILTHVDSLRRWRRESGSRLYMGVGMPGEMLGTIRHEPFGSGFVYIMSYVTPHSTILRALERLWTHGVDVRCLVSKATMPDDNMEAMYPFIKYWQPEEGSFHAKLVVTSRCLLVGSTNFSTYRSYDVLLRTENKDQRRQAKKEFLRVWDLAQNGVDKHV